MEHILQMWIPTILVESQRVWIVPLSQKLFESALASKDEKRTAWLFYETAMLFHHIKNTQHQVAWTLVNHFWNLILILAVQLSKSQNIGFGDLA